MTYNPVKPEESINHVVRIAYTATVDPALRGQMVVIKGVRDATAWDNKRVRVNLLNADGSLGHGYMVKPSLIIG